MNAHLKSALITIGCVIVGTIIADQLTSMYNRKKTALPTTTASSATK